jgi:hypothetical protein
MSTKDSNQILQTDTLIGLILRKSVIHVHDWKESKKFGFFFVVNRCAFVKADRRIANFQLNILFDSYVENYFKGDVDKTELENATFQYQILVDKRQTKEVLLFIADFTNVQLPAEKEIV